MKKVLITSGGTREPVDGVRYLTNFSSGLTGAQIADSFWNAGFAVTHLRAADALKAESENIESVLFVTSSDLKKHLKELLKDTHYDLIIHCAAVSDYLVDKIEADGKEVRNAIKKKLSSGVNLKIYLKPNIKIISLLKGFSKNEKIKIVGFKLTHNVSTKERALAVKKVFTSGADYVVHNDIKEIEPRSGKHVARIFNKKKMLTKISNKAEMAEALIKLAQEIL